MNTNTVLRLPMRHGPRRGGPPHPARHHPLPRATDPRLDRGLHDAFFRRGSPWGWGEEVSGWVRELRSGDGAEVRSLPLHLTPDPVHIWRCVNHSRAAPLWSAPLLMTDSKSSNSTFIAPAIKGEGKVGCTKEGRVYEYWDPVAYTRKGGSDSR